MKLRVLLADDDRVVRESLRMFLEGVADIEVVAEARDGWGVLEGVDQSRPDLVCMDLNMPGLNGIEATQQLLAAHPEVKVIGLSSHTYAVLVAQMISAGALGYVLKSKAHVELLPAIRQVSQGQTYFSPDLLIQDPAELERLALQVGAAAK